MDIIPLRLIQFSLLAFISTIFLIFGLRREVPSQKVFVPNHSFPDFGQYLYYHTVSAHQFPHNDPLHRILIVGDIHGMYHQLKLLLKKVSFDINSDVLIHVGDVVTKGSHKYSMRILDFLTSNNATGVRGNHDQIVIEWRAWLDWLRKFPGGSEWIDGIYSKWMQEKPHGKKLKRWLKRERLKDKSDWWQKIPHGWNLFDDHFRVAHDMTELQYDYLLSLPLVLYIPFAHAFIVHGGLVPFDLAYDYDDPRQPLAHIPLLPPGNSVFLKNETNAFLRHVQELCILNNISQNKVPWNVLNIRTIREGVVSKKTHGKEWSDVWNHAMDLCHGFEIDKHGVTKGWLPCYPSTVVYGHFAARGFDAKRWSIGLDSGCVSGGTLTGLLLNSAHRFERGHIINETDQIYKSWIPFGENGRGRAVSISCS